MAGTVPMGGPTPEHPWPGEYGHPADGGPAGGWRPDGEQPADGRAAGRGPADAQRPWAQRPPAGTIYQGGQAVGRPPEPPQAQPGPFAGQPGPFAGQPGPFAGQPGPFAGQAGPAAGQAVGSVRWSEPAVAPQGHPGAWPEAWERPSAGGPPGAQAGPPPVAGAAGAGAEPAGGRGGRSGRRGWLLSLLLLTVLALGGGAGYAVWPLRHALPLPTAAVTAQTSYQIPGAAPQWPWPAGGQAVVEVDGVGRVGAFGGDDPRPIASVAKVMTAYLILVDHPLGVGEAGPSLTITAAQADAYAAQAARGESLVRVTAGASFTERQALQAVLLPSANNMARILAEWDAGSQAAFVSRMNETAAALGMRATHYTDPAGYDPGTVSTAADQVVLARKAMALPALAEIVAQPSATVPVAGVVKNYNTLIGQDGVVGLKTGSTDQAGGCLSFAAKVTVGGRELLIVGAVLGQPGSSTPQQLQSVFAATRALVRAIGRALVVHTVIHAGQQVATVTGPLGTGTVLTAAQDVNLVGWAGLTVRLAADIPQVPARLAAGSRLGEVTLTAGEATAGTPLTSGARLTPPDAWTRIKHHR